MARDVLRLVTLSDGGRPVPILDLNDADGYWRDRDGGFTYTPAAPSQQISRSGRRFGGGRVVGELHDNGSIAWTAYVRGSSPAECAQRADALVEKIAATATGRYVEWRPDGLPSSFLEISGSGAWAPVIDPLQLSQGSGMRVQLTFPVFPLVRWAPMTVGDDFSVDSAADYTVDAIGGTTTIASGVLVSATNITSERRWRHTDRGYPLLEGQTTITSTPGATITGHKTGVLLRASASHTYVEVYVDDNGTSSRLRIDVIVGNARVNRATVNLAARIANGATFSVRGRVEGQTVYAEHWINDPSPMGVPTTTTSYGLSGGEQTSLVRGHTGFSWVPQHASATLDRFTSMPFTRRNLALPATIDTLDAIPGSAPAAADVLVSPSAGAAAPKWAMIAWGRAAASASTPPCILEAESATKVGWGTSSQAGARGGQEVRSVGATSFAALFDLSVLELEADEFTDGVANVEIWARVLVASSATNPRIRAALSGNVANVRSYEFGAFYKPIIKPSSGTVYRMVRLGILPVKTVKPDVTLRIEALEDSGVADVIGLDYVIGVLARRRAAAATGVPIADIGAFVPNTTHTTKRVRSDLSALSYFLGVGDPERTPGLGGSLIQPSPGRTRWLVKLSNLAPDDPTADTSTEQLAHNATVSVDVTPRSHLLRPA